MITLKYYIKKINTYTTNVWNGLEPIKIDKFLWDKTGYKPNTEVKMFYTDKALHIRFISEENQVKVEAKKFNDNVFEDSAVEFFFKPEPTKDSRYFNFEINAAGVLLLQLDSKTQNRTYLTDINPSIFNIKTDVTTENYKDFSNFKPWMVEYEIPFSFIRKYFKDFVPTPGYIMKGNFYKTGSKTKTPHYGSWAYIPTTKPNFHKPEYFNDLILQ